MRVPAIFLILAIGTALGDGHDLLTEYSFSAALAGDDYILHWTADLQGKELGIAVNVSTTGWVGFGISPNGQMPGSDVVIAWVDSDGETFLQDRYAAGRFLPPVDDSQDWVLVSGREENGRTIIELTRPFLSCDIDNDIDILAETSRVIWAYHSRDPNTEEELGTLQHEQMGSASINFLGGLNEERTVEGDSNSFTVLSDNVLIPNNDTTYWCTVHALPNEITSQEKFMYKFSPVISEVTAPFVHHLVAYMCTNLDASHVGASERCSGTQIDISVCRFTGVLFAAWAVGGTDFVFPNGVAYPIGGEGEQYIVLELHYDNPNMVEGMVDNSGLQFFYTNEAPENRAGLLTLGQQSRSTLIIPPRANNFVLNGLCPEQCTEKFFPREGINVFGNLLHTHLAGHGLTVKHLRRTDECNGIEELQPIDENSRYDFNYQQTTILPRTVQVLPGDTLHLQCSYRTSGPSFDTVTLGGESTREEMCLTFLYYYPRVDLTYCIGSQLAGEEFTEQYISPEYQDILQPSILSNDRQSVKMILNQVEWNQQSIQSFQTAIHSSTITTSCVSTTNLNESIVPVTAVPQVDCPYEPTPKDCPTLGVSKAGMLRSTTLLYSPFEIL